MAEKVYKISVNDDSQLKRLDKFLSEQTDLSRSRIQELLLKESVLVKPYRTLKPSDKTRLGEVYIITSPEAIDLPLNPQMIPLDIIFEDTHILVLNKQPGLVVHPAPGNWENTLVNALLHHCGDSLSGIGGVKRPGILHRLDKDTSGIMVIAKTDIAHQNLALQFQERSENLLKRYQALVWGRPHPSQGIIDAPIGRHPKLRQKMAVIKSGREARTTYKTLQTFISPIASKEQISLVECILHTGRTHQIRVHLQHIKTPILGDNIYGKKSMRKGIWPEQTYLLKRQALHAYSLQFNHPVTNEKMIFEAPLALDMQVILDAF